MAVCTRHCKSLLSAVVSSTREKTAIAVVSSKSSNNHVDRMLPSVCSTRALSTSMTWSCADNRVNAGQFSSAQYCWIPSHPERMRLAPVNAFAESKFTRHYSYRTDPEDFRLGYGGPIRTPVIDWRDRHVLDYKTFAKKIEQHDILLIDVRAAFEIESAGCIDNSINIPFVHFRTALLLSPDEFTRKYGATQPNKEDDNIVLMDLRGNRSEGALRISHELGFTKVTRFPGGFREWAEKNDLPIPPTYYEHGIPRDHWTNLKYDDLRMMIKRDSVYVIDVREPWEVVEQGSITNALNIPMGYVEFALNLNEADFEVQYGRRKPRLTDDIGFISWKGLRSAGCQLLAQELGYTKACTFLGGQERYQEKMAQLNRPGFRPYPLPRSHDDIYHDKLGIH